MKNLLHSIRNKFCIWVTGHDLETIDNAIINKDNDYISKSDFDPDDYDFSPLRDYDFSEFLTPENVDEQIECYLNNNDYITSEYIDEKIQEECENIVSELKSRLDKLEQDKPKKINLDKKPK